MGHEDNRVSIVTKPEVPYISPLAQLEEQVPSKDKVTGSSPVRTAKLLLLKSFALGKFHMFKITQVSIPGDTEIRLFPIPGTNRDAAWRYCDYIRITTADDCGKYYSTPDGSLGIDLGYIALPGDRIPDSHIEVGFSVRTGHYEVQNFINMIRDFRKHLADILGVGELRRGPSNPYPLVEMGRNRGLFYPIAAR